MNLDHAVVVVNYGSSRLLAQNLAPLVSELPHVRCIVVDNFSGLPERQAITTLGDSLGWTIVRSPNGGFGAGVNLGIRTARALGCTTVLILNPDVELTPGSARALFEAASDKVVAPKILRPDGSVWFDGGHLDLSRGIARGRGGIDWLTGACIAAPLSVLDTVHDLSEEYFMYWEDVDLSYRLREAGFSLTVLQNVTAVHQVGGTQTDSDARRKSDLYYRYNCRGRLVFATRNLDSTTRRRWIPETIPFAWNVLLRGGRRQLLTTPGPVFAVLRGTLEGLWFMIRGGKR